ncbi:hypothetical protein AAEU32_03680 [Pseudoalteromonas sp. SSDWG2]|uniref:hypothetical protein n=1 Tax=Pseudoalteromonas sp. SSDWG2 TaxID=3139391 RepID=UPI003BA9BAD3
MAKARRSETNTFTMSFLDLVSAGFGAAFFLFLIFASLPITPSGGMAGSTEYIDVELQWSERDYLLELVVYPPQGEPLRLGHPHIQIDPLSGQIYLSEQHNTQLINGFKAAYLTGSSAYGEQSLQDQGSHQEFVHLRVIDPCPGQWRFAINVNNRRGSAAYMHSKNGTAKVPLNKLNAYTSTEDLALSAAYISTVKEIDLLQNLSAYLGGTALNTFSAITWQSPDNTTTDTLTVKEPKEASSKSHCRIGTN